MWGQVEFVLVIVFCVLPSHPLTTTSQQMTTNPVTTPQQTTTNPVTTPQQTTTDPVTTPQQTTTDPVTTPQQTTTNPVTTAQQTTTNSVTNTDKSTEAPKWKPRIFRDARIGFCRYLWYRFVMECHLNGEEPTDDFFEKIPWSLWRHYLTA
ncbi:unnamed protein product [Calicophoron daubneyi]|uniref:Uncharacterized protein n=1 Tax=Calicophoron daubneyi TaxID=300641 RepID=A0AAV2TPA3_CALDB